jgi:peptidoglycan/xylan/chitin deacetylase (PgdA/CDA1 family)
MRSVVAMICVLMACVAVSPASASGCPGNPDALGTARTIVVDPAEHPLLGGLQYRESLPLNDKEVVITFDDGPLPPYSTRILDILAGECVKATYFMVGRMVRAYPKLVRRTHEEGHTIGNHSQNHPFSFHRMTVAQAAQEIEAGFESLRNALGENANDVAPFFRFPGLLRQDSVEDYLASRKIMSWSVDFMADDWRRISAAAIVERSLARLESKGKGILLLHDIQPATALALPTLLRELKARGYRIVHVVPAAPGRVKTATAPEQWLVRRPQQSARQEHAIWPRVGLIKPPFPEPVLEAPSVRSFGAADATRIDVPVALVARPAVLRGERGEVPIPLAAAWPRTMADAHVSNATHLPAPGVENFRYPRGWKQRTGKRVSRSKLRTRPQAKKIQTGINDAGTHSKERHVRPESKRSKANTKDAGKPDRKQRSGHQIQAPKPTASLWNTITKVLSP